MAQSTMLWPLFLLTVAASAQNRPVVHTTHLDGAMIGLNPVCMNHFEKPNPGKKSMLLHPLLNPIYNPSDDLVPSPFINVAEEAKCIPELTVHTVMNFAEYRDFIASSTYKLSSTDSTEIIFHRYGNDILCGAKKHHIPDDMKQFFKDTGGEVLFASAECLTHTISISPFEPLAFTPAFETALINLYKASLNPNTKTSDETFTNFIWFYGTHFSKQTQLGSKVVFGKLFARGAASEQEEETRRRCVLEAAREALMPCLQWCNETTSMSFNRESSARCGQTEHGVLTAVIGPVPENTFQDWGLVAEEFPDPIFYHLESISTLFTREWKSPNPEIMNINKKSLNVFFNEKLNDFINRTMASGYSQALMKGSGSHNVCDIQDNCLDGANTESEHKCFPKDGGIIMVGGATSSPANSLALFMPAPPPFPVKVYANTLSRMCSVLYSCGGAGRENDKTCWRLETRAHNTTWEPFNIPWELVSHSAVVVQNDIWLFFNSSIKVIHTRNIPHTFSEINVEFSFPAEICTVSHNSQIFVIGVGKRQDEIYVNSDSNKPDEWKRVSQLLQGRYGFACIVYGGQILVTGGKKRGAGETLSSVESISVLDGTVINLEPLNEVRGTHQMAIIQGRPAVLGGWNGKARMATIETYDELKSLWEPMELSLSEARNNFGLIQYHR